MRRIEQDSNPESEKVISQGKWNDIISWQFIIDHEAPNVALCTAVCCVLTHNNKLCVVKNKRGWELPAGKIEKDELPEEAVIREVSEEYSAKISMIHLFGYKKLTAIEPIQRPGLVRDYYPFPHSYVLFYYASVLDFVETDTAQDISDRNLVSYEEALSLLSASNQYEGILEYLVTNRLIDLK